MGKFFRKKHLTSLFNDDLSNEILKILIETFPVIFLLSLVDLMQENYVKVIGGFCLCQLKIAAVVGLKNAKSI